MVQFYWDAYDATLRRVAEERPSTFAALKAILDEFQHPSSGDAFFPDGADDELSGALRVAGWDIAFGEASYVYTARHPETGETFRFVEGDLYEGTR